jgi:hypothetical protein
MQQKSYVFNTKRNVILFATAHMLFPRALLTEICLIPCIEETTHICFRMALQELTYSDVP